MSDDKNNDKNVAGPIQSLNGLYSLRNFFSDTPVYLSADLTDPDEPKLVVSDKPFFWHVVSPIGDYVDTAQGSIFIVREDGVRVFIQPGPTTPGGLISAVLSTERKAALWSYLDGPASVGSGTIKNRFAFCLDDIYRNALGVVDNAPVFNIGWLLVEPNTK
ncbi:hypothetical protein ACFSE0_11105 [Ochrobactrum teleogrylli]|uniref:Uncharacterized protein n=1 Tax=Ochrobactrum teleogrylli TaxID=2479765 RepID=A0ABY2Y0G0_9HYPH|nr:hypothetical protein [[Ochrobactrum] teleogrylli]TNV09201.1 hypothetical protein FIC94_22200 [[Ochrobactrum] teleogrylli]